MTVDTDDHRRFRVRARHEDGFHGRLVAEDTFEAAALAYVEHLPLSPQETREISVIVTDVHSGHEHSFVVHFDRGQAAVEG